MSKMQIHCYSRGFVPGRGKLCYSTMSVIEDQTGILRKVHETFSTDPKWQQQDIGHKRITNIKAWCGDYDQSKALYDQLFGEDNWTTVWYDKNPFIGVTIYQMLSEYT